MKDDISISVSGNEVISLRHIAKDFCWMVQVLVLLLATICLMVHLAGSWDTGAAVSIAVFGVAEETRLHRTYLLVGRFSSCHSEAGVASHGVQTMLVSLRLDTGCWD